MGVRAIQESNDGNLDVTKDLKRQHLRAENDEMKNVLVNETENYQVDLKTGTIEHVPNIYQLDPEKSGLMLNVTLVRSMFKRSYLTASVFSRGENLGFSTSEPSERQIPVGKGINIYLTKVDADHSTINIESGGKMMVFEVHEFGAQELNMP